MHIIAFVKTLHYNLTVLFARVMLYDIFAKNIKLLKFPQVEQDIPAKRSRIECNSDSDLITSTPQTRGLSNKSVSRVCRKSQNKGTVDPYPFFFKYK